VDVEVVRVDSRDLAATRRLFELFTDIENYIDDLEEPSPESMAAVKKVDTAIALWTEMQVSDSEKMAKFAANVEFQHNMCTRIVSSLVEHLQALHFVHCASSVQAAANPSACKSSDAEARLAGCQALLATSQEEHGTLRTSNSLLARRVEDLETELQQLKQAHQHVQTESEHVQRTHTGLGGRCSGIRSSGFGF
jgi:chromosome segregation ATPase